MNFLATANTIGVYELQIAARKIMHEFFSDIPDLPLPVLKVVDRTSAKYLGRCIYKGKGSKTTTIEIQKSVLADQKSLDRVLCHEIIHHVQFMTEQKSDHGQAFLDLAKKINHKRGPDYVTVKSDETYELSDAQKEFYLLIWKDDRHGLVYQICMKPSPTQTIEMQDKVKNKNAKLIHSRDRKWMDGAKVGSNKISLPADTKQKEALEDLMRNAPAALHEAHSVDYFMLIRPFGKDLGYTISPRLTPKQKETVKELEQFDQAKLVKTNKAEYLGAPTIKESGKWRVPKDDKTQAELRHLYEGKEALAASFLVNAGRYPEAKKSKHKGDSYIIYEAGGRDPLNPFGHDAFDNLVEETEGEGAVEDINQFKKKVLM